METIRADIVELLRAGLSDREIARQVQVGTLRVAAARAALGLPRCPPGNRPAATVEDLFWRRAIHTSNGHLLWPSAKPRIGVRIKHTSGRFSVYKVAFRIGNHRDPIGKVTTGCDQLGCIHPRHVQDQPARNLDRTFAAIFGEVAA